MSTTPDQKVDINQLRDACEPAVLAIATAYNIPQHRAVEAYGHLIRVAGYLVGSSEAVQVINNMFDGIDLSKEIGYNVSRLGLLTRKLRARNKPFLSAANKIGRNEPCPCKSGAKYKNCCLNKIKAEDLERYNERNNR